MARKKLNITAVSYRTNIITPNDKFRSKHVEATATVGASEDPSEVLVDLARWVHDQLGIARQPCSALRNLGDETKGPLL